MIGGDQTIPGADGRGGTPFSVIEQVDVLKAPGKSGGKRFSEIEQLDSLKGSRQMKGAGLDMDAIQKVAEADPIHEPGEFNFDQVKKIISRKVLDASQLDQAIKTITDLLGDTPTIKSNWRDEYMKDSDGGRATERRIKDVEQLSEAIGTIRDLLGDDVFMNKTGWRDEYQAQNEAKTPFEKIEQVDRFPQVGLNPERIAARQKMDAEQTGKVVKEILGELAKGGNVSKAVLPKQTLATSAPKASK